MSETPGLTAPVYQSLTQPQLLAGVPRTFAVGLVMGMGLLIVWCLQVPALWPGLLLGPALYCVTWCGTKYDTEFFDILIAHVRHHTHYEG